MIKEETYPHLERINKLLQRVLSDSSPYIRNTAIIAFTRIRFHEPKVVVPRLIKMLDDTEVATTASVYLELYTSMDHAEMGKDAPKWKEWWEENKDTFEPHEYWH